MLSKRRCLGLDVYYIYATSMLGGIDEFIVQGLDHSSVCVLCATLLLQKASSKADS